jgi:hypothetical protein
MVFHVALQLSAPLDYPFSNSKRKSDDWTIDVFIFPLESQLRRLAVCESLSRSREADHHSHHTRNEIFVPVGNILPLILTADIKGQNLGSCGREFRVVETYRRFCICSMAWCTTVPA